MRCAISGDESRPPEITGNESQVILDLADVARNITVKNFREYYHDGIEYRDQMYSLFNLGMLDLPDRAKAENLFWDIARKAVRYSKTAKFVADEFVELESKLHEKYVCNFSVFQSLPDHWALDQLFPVIPIHRLNEEPRRRATLADITCDSDGEIEKFVDLKDIKSALEVHELLPDQPYYIGVALIGAYQDTMGDMHNLFGRVHEADVVLEAGGATAIGGVWRGETASDTIRSFGYEPEQLVETMRDALKRRVAAGGLTADEADGLLEDYRRRLSGYTYLD